MRALALLLCLSACARAEARGPVCRLDDVPAPLPPAVRETSGIAAGRAHPGVYWTHNDSDGDPVVYALDGAGRLVGAVEVRGARNRDWEDIATGPCAAGACLYLADTGDNDSRRDDVEIYRVPEPDPAAKESARAERFRFRYPGGPRDAEALFVLPDGGVYVVTKGRESPVEVYRVPLDTAGTATAERVAVLSPRPVTLLDMVTAATVDPAGRWVAIRTYTALYLYRPAALLRGEARPAHVFDLRAVGQLQGEGVALLDDGEVLLTAEGEGGQAPPTLARLRCDLAPAAEP